MSLDWGDIRPVPANWFQSSGQYEGIGHADFAAGFAIRGPAVVSFGEHGEARARMTSPVVLSGGQDPDPDMSRFLLSEPRCLRLTVSSEHGTFETNGRVSYTWEDTDLFRSAEDPSSVTVTFRWLRAQFVAGHGGHDERYWVLPLLNLLLDPKQHVPELDRHPLRIYPTPVIPAEADQDRAFFRRAYANQRNQLVIFECFGELGFIERLTDYEERESALKSGAERRLLTSVMSGQAGGASDTWEAVSAWFPFDFLRLLAMASGAPVGAPWLEFRDGNGALARRWHVQLGSPDYSRGHAAIDESLHPGMGLLLTRAIASREFGSPALRVALRHLVDGLVYEQPIEERLGHLCRGIEGLSNAYGVAGRNLLKGLGPKYRKCVKQALAEVQKAMHAMAAEAAESGDTGDAALLESIAHRTVSNPAYVDHNFGDSAIRLMRHFGLPDPGVMDRFFAAETKTIAGGAGGWAKWLSDCRGTPMHGGYFDIAGGGHDPRLLWQTTQHLLDILLRVIFKIVGYDGTYQPAVAQVGVTREVGWVGPDTPPEALGYR